MPEIRSARYPEILQWSEQTIPLADRVYRTYLNIFFEALRKTVHEKNQSIWEKLTALPESSIQLIVEAPETYERLNAALRNVEHFQLLENHLLDSILVEQHRTSGIADRALKMWSAIGDYFADAADAKDDFSEAGWRLSGKYTSKRIAFVPIDHASIYARARMPVASFRSVVFGEPIAFRTHEAKAAEDKVIEAFNSIRRSCPYAAKFISRYVKSIILRKNIDDTVFQSASRNAFVGQVVLLNPHAEHVDVAYVAESLVHESIHALMWRQEILSHFLIEPKLDMGTVRSPWSGEEVYFYTLLQAVFVWYGIAQFWLQAMRTSEFPRSRASWLYKRSIKGFFANGLYELLEARRNNLRQGILDVFQEMIVSVQVSNLRVSTETPGQHDNALQVTAGELGVPAGSEPGR